MPKIRAYTTQEAAKVFGVTVHAIRDWIEDQTEGGMRAIKVGNILYITEDEMRRYYLVRFGHEMGNRR